MVNDNVGIIVLTLLMIGLILGAYIAFTFLGPKDNEKLDGGFSYNVNVTLSAQDYAAIKSKFNDKPIVNVCNIDNQNCIALIKFDALNKLK